MSKKYDNYRKRVDYIDSMYWWGDRGIWDFSEQNKNIVEPTKELVKNGRLKELPSDYDVRGFDMPRPDIRGYHTKATNLVRVGNDSKQNIGLFGSNALQQINHAFSHDELARLNVYFEYPSSKLRHGVLGQTASDDAPDGRKYSLIDINRVAMKDEPTIVHETLHAIRYRDGYDINDRDTDEAMVELETIARVSKDGLMRMKNCLGYYSYMTNGWEKLKKDRILLTGSLDKNLVGKEARNRTLEMFTKANISRLKVGTMTDRKGKIKKKRSTKIVNAKSKMHVVPEWLDQYFYVVTPKNKSMNIHIQLREYAPPKEIIADIKRTYGKTTKIWQYRDGKRVKITS